MIAIQDLNPDSFKQGNINFLKKDQLLETPDLYLLDIYDRYQSIRDVAEQNSIIDSKYTDYVARNIIGVFTIYNGILFCNISNGLISIVNIQ